MPRTFSRSAPGPGIQGTMGGPAPVGPRPGKRLPTFGDEVYLWVLITLEVLAIGFLRHLFSRYHGG